MTNMVNKQTPEVTLHTDNNCLAICFVGNFKQYDGTTVLSKIRGALKTNLSRICFNASQLGEWDSSLLLIIFETVKLARYKKIAADLKNLPTNIQDLINLAFEVNRSPSKTAESHLSFIENLGFHTINIYHISAKVLHFCFQTFGAIGRLFAAASVMRKKDFLTALNDCGPQALAIVSLISFLVGLILAFVGGVQLQEFGAQIYIASLVTIGMCRIMGAIMVGIIMAGRTGSS